MVLEVLAGLRTPAEATQAVGLSTQRYYLLEDRALSGLVSACEPRGRGPSSSPEKELDKLHTECEKLRRECARYQALARVSQKTVGISAPPARRPEKRAGKGRGKRKPTVRALKLAAQLKAGSAEAERPSLACKQARRNESGGPA